MFLIDDEFKPKVKEDIYENQVKHEESLNTDDDDDNKLVIKDDPYSQDESDAPNNMSQVNFFYKYSFELLLLQEFVKFLNVFFAF